MRFFDKEGFLWLNWRDPNPPNLIVLMLLFFFIAYGGTWAVYGAIKYLPWPGWK